EEAVAEAPKPIEPTPAKTDETVAEAPKTEPPAPKREEAVAEAPKPVEPTPAKTDETVAETPKPEPPPLVLAPMKGDYNHNGRLDLEDAEALNREILSGRTPDPDIWDCTQDGEADCADVLAIMQAQEKNP
ncbi:MAG: hypothetical protein HYY16_14820, partial [Planctomycetes bacterium]|nr:hypothetical protein [Planctomycetota bacterium]